MINVSQAYKDTLNTGRRNFNAVVNITLADGTILPTLTNVRLRMYEIEDAVSSDNSFTMLGSAIINKATITIDNLDDRFSGYDFANATVICELDFALINDTTERIRKGVFTVDDTNYNGGTIVLTCLDNMVKFDRPYSDSKLVYPADLGEIVRNACSVCDVMLNTYTFPHNSFVIQERPADDATTFREVISYCAQIAGCYARCNKDGKLEFSWFDKNALANAAIALEGGVFDDATPTYESGVQVDGGSFNPWNVGYQYNSVEFGDISDVHRLLYNYSMNIATEDIVITGVTIDVVVKTANRETLEQFIVGQPGYVITIEKNPFITTDNAPEIVNWLGNQLIGVRFRKADITHLNNPTIEAGDIAILIDRKNNTHPFIITKTVFGIGASQKTSCSAETVTKNNSTRFSETVKNYIELTEQIKQEKTDREMSLDDLATRLMSETGLHTTIEPTSSGNIIYMHNKADLNSSDIIWKMTTEAFGVSTDGGNTWNAGLTVDGDAIVRILSAVGINFDWGTGGTLTLGGVNNRNGWLRILNSAGEQIGKWDNTGAQISGDIILKKGNLTVYIGSSNYYYGTGVKRSGAGFKVSMGEDTESASRGFVHYLNKSSNKVLEDFFIDSENMVYYAPVSYSSISFDYQRQQFLKSSNSSYHDMLIGYEYGFGRKMQIRDMTNSNKQILFTELFDGINQRYLIGRHNNDTQCVEFFEIRKGKIKVIAPSSGSEIKLAVTDDIDEIAEGKVGQGISIKSGTIFFRVSGTLATSFMRFTSSGLYEHGGYVAHESSSSQRYKHNITENIDEELDAHRLYSLPMKQFVYNDDVIPQYDDMAGKTIPGFIAEEVAEIYPSAVIHNRDTGEIESWDERRIIPGMLKLIQEQHDKINDLENRLAKLESVILNLGGNI